MIDYVKCLECKTEKSREDTFLDIPLPVRAFESNIAYGSVVRIFCFNLVYSSYFRFFQITLDIKFSGRSVDCFCKTRNFRW